jgi:hypothetical protein
MFAVAEPFNFGPHMMNTGPTVLFHNAFCPYDLKGKKTLRIIMRGEKIELRLESPVIHVF